MKKRKRMIQKAAEQIKLEKAHDDRLWDELMESIQLARADDRKPHEKVVDTTQDRAPEVYWGLKSYNTDDPEAECKKGLEYLHQREYFNAHICFLKAVRSGYPEAQYRLGSLYLYGRGVKTDLNLAEIWFRESAANGYQPYAAEALEILKRYRRK